MIFGGFLPTISIFRPPRNIVQLLYHNTISKFKFNSLDTLSPPKKWSAVTSARATATKPSIVSFSYLLGLSRSCWSTSRYTFMLHTTRATTILSPTITIGCSAFGQLIISYPAFVLNLPARCSFRFVYTVLHQPAPTCLMSSTLRTISILFLDASSILHMIHYVFTPPKPSTLLKSLQCLYHWLLRRISFVGRMFHLSCKFNCEDFKTRGPVYSTTVSPDYFTIFEDLHTLSTPALGPWSRSRNSPLQLLVFRGVSYCTDTNDLD